MPKIKICGLTRLEDIEAVNEAKPDFVGFVFVQSSRRCLTVEKAQQLKAALSPGIQSVGVFVNAPLREICTLYEKGLLELIQLHGQEDEAYIAQLRASVHAPIIQAFGIRTPCDITAAAHSGADYVLLDTQSAGAFGGTGTSFDWSMIPPQMSPPYFLAGGLKAENLPQAMSLSPYALDISSGVETGGYKDKEKIKNIVTMVRSGKHV